MAGSARDIKNKITSTKKISQITKAMHMVSAAKLRRAEKTMKEYRPFMQSVKDTIGHILSSNIEVTHKMLERRPVKKTGYLLITSDRGLAGGYNNNLFRQFFNDLKIEKRLPDDYVIGVLGNKGYQYFRNKDVNIANDHVIYLRDDVQFIDIISIIQKMIDLYLLEEIDEIIVYYNKYVNTIKQDIIAERILPVDKIEGDENQVLYDLEPSPQEVLNTLMPVYIQNVIYGYILNAKASEHAATMTAMKNSTDNAKEIVENLTLHYNRARQAAITQEITEIIGGAAALT